MFYSLVSVLLNYEFIIFSFQIFLLYLLKLDYHKYHFLNIMEMLYLFFIIQYPFTKVQSTPLKSQDNLFLFSLLIISIDTTSLLFLFLLAFSQKVKYNLLLLFINNQLCL